MTKKEEKERQEICHWLSPLKVFATHQDIFLTRQAGTGEWLLESAEFKEWVSDTGKTLLCTGIPGAGKTILASMVVEELRKRYEDDPKVGVACIYCDYKAKDQTPVDVLAGLWSQLAMENKSIHISEVVKDMYPRHKREGTRPAVHEVSTALHTEISRFTKVFIILDALDECPEHKGRQNPRATLLSELFSLPSKVKLMVTSRPHLNFERFKDASCIEVRASEADVRKYLEGQISRLNSCVGNDTAGTNLKETIINSITQVVDGMFLLARLHIESLITKVTRRDIKAALKVLPTGENALDEAYNEAITRIENQPLDHKQTAMRVLSWILFARRPLSVNELQHSLAVNPGDLELDADGVVVKESLTDYCAGLVVIDQTSDTVRLVHATTQTYFENIQKIRFPLQETQKNIVTTCLTYLLFNIFSTGPCANDIEMEARLEESYFLQYAAQHWGTHARGGSEKLIQELVINFFKQVPNLSCAVQAMHISNTRLSGYSQRYPKNVEGLWVAAYFGLEEVVKFLLADGADCTTKTSYGESALYISSQNGHEQVVRLLLLEKAVDVNDKINRGETALHGAAGVGHEAVVQLLLENGADVDVKSTNGCTPLYLAAENGHNSVVGLLLQHGADFMTEDNHGTTALDKAAWCEHEEVVQRLLILMLDNPDSIKNPERIQWIIKAQICRAEGRGNRRVVEELFKKLAEPGKNFDEDWISLQRATVDGDQKMVQICLDYKADINGKDSSGRTPLHQAAATGQHAIARLLIERGADLAVIDDYYGWTPLRMATERQQRVMMQLLLDKGADPADARLLDKENGSSESSSEATDALAKNNGPTTSLYDAARSGQLPVVIQLLTDGADIHKKSETGWTALHWAADAGHEDVVQYLLSSGASPDTPDNEGVVALHLSCLNRHVSVTNLLLSAGAWLEARMTRVDGTTEKSGGTPLHWACITGHADIVLALLQSPSAGRARRAKIEARNQWYRTPLHIAARYGHQETVKTLLANGADLESRRDTDETPLHFAVEENQYEMVKLLIEAGANLEARGNRGTPLHFAIRMGFGRVKELLEQAAADGSGDGDGDEEEG